MSKAESHIFGVVLMNDWSARDIQKWDGALGGLEAVPSFGPAQKDPKPLPYLSDPNYAHGTYDIKLNPGDLLGSGTISGSTETSLGSMLELSWQRSQNVQLEDSGITRKFLQDGDTVVITGYCKGNDHRIGFGSCEGKILPAYP
ncbi:putative fumarylacetoacetase [Plasmopara halstedii]